MIVEIMVAGIVSVILIGAVSNIFLQYSCFFILSQTESFRKKSGKTFASIMYAGNLRSRTERVLSCDYNKGFNVPKER